MAKNILFVVPFLMLLILFSYENTKAEVIKCMVSNPRCTKEICGAVCAPNKPKCDYNTCCCVEPSINSKLEGSLPRESF
ncbi:hypothetical protein RND81_12G210500 [Saponaria officinalis]|uniref:Uncharacterized protein n=1 Tax=Saponaria officinalis TaxID=3572 RepID=A0AAW1HDJ4_SAPOF